MQRKHLALLPLALVASSAFADSFYIGGSAGSVALDIDNTDITIDSDDTGWSVHAGIPLGDMFAIEIGYTDLGRYSELFVLPPIATNFDAEIAGVDAFGVLKLPVGPLNLYGKAGVIFWEAETEALLEDTFNVPQRFRRDEDGTDLALGIGAEVDIGDNLAVRGEFEWFDVEDTDRVSFISLGISYRF
ncbi:MAG: outer membrane beta-barrel protein [Pseudomonadota bacterium]